MGRLIDADSMVKRLQEWNRNDDMDKALYNFAFNRIMEQPTAFNVEAVVEEIHEYFGKIICVAKEPPENLLANEGASLLICGKSAAGANIIPFGAESYTEDLEFMEL